MNSAKHVVRRPSFGRKRLPLRTVPKGIKKLKLVRRVIRAKSSKGKMA